MFDPTRRQFVGLGLGAAAVSMLPKALRGEGAPARPLRLGLIGCTSGGLGLVNAALEVDPRVHLVALADAEAARAERARTVYAHVLRRGGPHPRALVAADRVFAGRGASRELCAGSDIDAVLLACSAAECPESLAAAVEAGKPAYLLGPGAADAAGCRALESLVGEAKRRGLTLGAGLFWRHDGLYRHLVARVRAGQIGSPRRAEPVQGRSDGDLHGVARPGDELLLASHFRGVELMNWIAGEVPRPVTVRGAAGGAVAGVRYEYPSGLSFAPSSDPRGDTSAASAHRLAGSAGELEFQPPRAVATEAHREARRRSVEAFLAEVRGEGSWESELPREAPALVAATRAAVEGCDAIRASA